MEIVVQLFQKKKLESLKKYYRRKITTGVERIETDWISQRVEEQVEIFQK